MKMSITRKYLPADYEYILPAYYDTGINSHSRSEKNENDLLFKELIFDSLLTENGKSFPVVKGLENDELWFEMITTMVNNKYTDEKQYGEAQEYYSIISRVVNQERPHSKGRSKKSGYLFLAAALILLSVVSISLVIKMMLDKNSISIASINTKSDVQNHGADSILNREDRMLNKNREFKIIDLDSGSRAFVDSGALVSDIQIEDKRVTVHVLRGAVAFSVAKKKTREFVVKAGLADIVVTGTKFKVIRMDDVVTVAVNNGSVNTMYKNGTRKIVLTDGQVAMVMKDAITVLTNDSIPDIPERKLLKNLLEIDADIDDGFKSISKKAADSLLDKIFTSGVTDAAEGDLIEHFSLLLESKGRWEDALTVLRHHPEFSNNRAGYNSLTKLKSTLFLKTGDTSTAVKCMENAVANLNNQTDRCDGLYKLYKLHLKNHNLLKTDTCLHSLVECTQMKAGLDKVIIDHAHQLRNAFMIDAALFWYEYVLENFAESKCRKDAEYWISDCVIKKGMEKNSALYNTSTSSGQ
jgi:hypothetical protein